MENLGVAGERLIWYRGYPDKMATLEVESSLKTRSQTWGLLRMLRSSGHDMSKLHFFPYERGVMIEWPEKGIYCEIVDETGEFEVQRVSQPDESGLIKIETTSHTSMEKVVDEITQLLELCRKVS